MIWIDNPSSGTYRSGWYTIFRDSRGQYNLWLDKPKRYERIGRATTLKEAKSDAEQHAKAQRE